MKLVSGSQWTPQTPGTKTCIGISTHTPPHTGHNSCLLTWHCVQPIFFNFHFFIHIYLQIPFDIHHQYHWLDTRWQIISIIWMTYTWDVYQRDSMVVVSMMSVNVVLCLSQHAALPPHHLDCLRLHIPGSWHSWWRKNKEEGSGSFEAVCYRYRDVVA